MPKISNCNNGYKAITKTILYKTSPQCIIKTGRFFERGKMKKYTVNKINKPNAVSKINIELKN